MESSNNQEKPTDWTPTSTPDQPSDWTPSQPKVLQDYTKMEDDYGREIDRLVKEKHLTDEQFQTYTNGYCWYCGRPYSAIDGAKHIRTLKFTKEVRKTEGIKKITTTFTKTVSVPECTDCKAYHAVHDEKTKSLGTASIIIGYIVVICALGIISSNSGNPTAVWVIGILASLALMMLVALIGWLVIWPFKAIYDLITHEKEKNPQPTLRNESDIPLVIRARKAGFN